MEAVPREVRICRDNNGREPFNEWLNRLDAKTEAIILKRLERVENGNLGDVSPVGEAVSELKIDFGPGYRVYFGQRGNKIHLICGGTKQGQQADIESAKAFWRDYD